MADITAADVRNGRDIQGISWVTSSREHYRKNYRRCYQDHQNIRGSVESAAKNCKWSTRKVGNYYYFRRFSRSLQSSCIHFQLKNLLWATSMHDVYTTSNSKIFHWSSEGCVTKEVLDVSGLVAPTEQHPGNLYEGFPHTEVSTMAVKDRMLIVGGSRGELIVKNLDKPGVCYCVKTGPNYNPKITTAIEFYTSRSGAHHFIVSKDDCEVRDYDMETFQLSNRFHSPFKVNHSSMSPDGKCLLAVGDAQEFILVDASTNRPIHTIKSHFDYGSASAWHPDGSYFATGNEDKTCRIWEPRKLPSCFSILKGNIGAIRSIQFTFNGQYMAMAESADFVHIYDVHSEGGYRQEQEIDFFGEILGMCFSPQAESLFVSVDDSEHGGLLEFSNRMYKYYHQVG